MTTIQALNRIYWRFGGNNNANPFPVNENDIEAFNLLYDDYNRRQKEQFHDYTLFAKLFIYLYMKILLNDGSTIEDGFARRKIYNLLKKPLSQIIEDFQKSLNESGQYAFLNKITGVEEKDHALQTEAEKAANLRKLEEMLKDPENRIKFFGDVWDYDKVQMLAEAEVNQAINYFK